MNRKKKVIVVGHEASLSGAPILLLNLFRLLIEKNLADVQFVIRKDGPLVKEYKKLAPVTVLKPQNYGIEENVFVKLKNIISNKSKLFIILFKALFVNYLFFNTVVNGKFLRWFHFHRKPIVTYIHELENVIDLYLKQGDAVLPLSHSTVIACPTNTTSSVLEAKYCVPQHRLIQLRYFFSFSKSDFDLVKFDETRKRFRNQFNIDEGDFLVGTVGTITERKGIDLFIDVCKRTILINSAIKFVWIGAFESEEKESTVREMIEESGLGRNLIFTGLLAHDIYNFSSFDIFFLSSREDTYPLVVLEAAMMKVPTICFSGSGGIVEFVGNDAGWLIQDFSTTEASKKITELKENEPIVHAYGTNAFDKVISIHCNEANIIDQYNCIIGALK